MNSFSNTPDSFSFEGFFTEENYNKELEINTNLEHDDVLPEQEEALQSSLDSNHGLLDSEDLLIEDAIKMKEFE